MSASSPLSELAPSLLRQLQGARQSGALLLSGEELTVDELAIILDALKDEEIYYLNITSPLGEDGGRCIADFLSAHPEMEKLLLDASPLGDRGLAALAPVIATHPGIRKFSASECGVSKEGVEHFFSYGGLNPNLTYLDLLQSEEQESFPLFEKHILAANSKNLYQAFPCETTLPMLRQNSNAADECIKHFPAEGVSELTGAELRRIHARKALVFFDDKWHGKRRGIDRSAKTQGLPVHDALTAEKAYDTLLKTLPRIDETTGAESLFLPAGEGAAKGFAPLDNPLLWEGKNIEDFKALPLNKALLERRTPKGSTLLDAAISAFPLEEIVAHLNSKHIKLQESALLTESGAPTELLQRCIEERELHKLFTKENWAGTNADAFSAFYQKLPTAAKEQVPYQSIRSYLQTSSTQGRGR